MVPILTSSYCICHESPVRIYTYTEYLRVRPKRGGELIGDEPVPSCGHCRFRVRRVAADQAPQSGRSSNTSSIGSVCASESFAPLCLFRLNTMFEVPIRDEEQRPGNSHRRARGYPFLRLGHQHWWLLVRRPANFPFRGHYEQVEGIVCACRCSH
jgi:hypothetical protein